MVRKGRVEIKNKEEYLQVSIRLVRNYYVIVSMLVCALGWLLGVVFIVDRVVQNYHTIIELGIAGILFIWLAVGAAILTTLIWIFRGREKIMITSDHIQTEKPIHIYKRRRAYPIREVSNIRVERELFKVMRNKEWVDDQRIVLKFETPYKSITFGRGLTSEEAEFILLELAKNEYLQEQNFQSMSKS